MSVYAITFAPDVEQILVDELRAYFQTEVKTSELFRNYSTVRISNTHPFAHLIDEAINGVKVPVDLFPCITVISESDSKSVQTPPLLEEKTLVADDIEEIIENRDLYVVSDQTVAAIQSLVTANGKVFALGSAAIRGVSISIEIWAENIDLKNRLYDLCQAFIVGKRRYDINEKYGIKLQEHAMTGQRSGQYNFDFGKLLYGGSIRIPSDAVLSQYFVDSALSEQTEIKSVAVSTNGVY